MNYHFNVPTNNKLLQQLQEIDQDIQSKRYELQKKQIKQKQLQSQFYQDNNKIQLADQIMNQLLAGYSKNTNKPPVIREHQIQEDSLNIQRNKYDNLWKNSQKRAYEQSINKNSRQLRHDFPIQQQRKQQYKNSRISYQTEDKRELQKRKLQERRQQQFFPLEQRKIKAPIEYPVSIPPPNNKIKNKEVNNQINPFLKDDNTAKQKKQQQLRNYYKELERQRQFELQRKQRQKKEKKQQLYQFHGYVPPTVPPTAIQTDNIANKQKKVDPNGKPPQIQTQSLNSDKYYMKLKVDQLKQKRKKGRIDEDQYQQSLRKIQQFYGIKLQEETLENTLQNKNQQSQKNYFDRVQQSREKQIEQQAIPHKIQQLQQQQMPQKPAMNEAAQLQQSKHNNQNTLNSNNSYSNSHLAFTKQFSEIEREMMMKLLEDMRQMYKNSLMHNQKIMQEAFMTQMQMFPQYQHFQNSVAQTMQMPAKNHFPDSSLQKNSHFSDSKPQNYSATRNVSNNHISKQFGQSQLSEGELQQKSLSGIVTKIPLTQKQIQQADAHKNFIEQFYTKKYKIKQFKSFPYVEAANPTKKQINHVTNFLELGQNGKNELRNSFAEDLQMYKKMQIEKQVAALKSKVIQDKKPKKIQQVSNKNDESKQNTSKPSAFQKKKNHDDQPIVNRQEEFSQFYSKQAGLNFQKILTEKELVTPSRQNNIFGNPFLKRHISDRQQNYYKQYEQNSTPVPKIPDANSNPILQQQEYQTQSKEVSRSIKTLQQESVNKGSTLSIKQKPFQRSNANNQMFRKLAARDYKSPSQQSFGQISPVRVEVDPHAYQSSLQTLKSQQFQSKEKIKRGLDSAQSNGFGISQAISQGTIGYTSPKHNVKELQFIESRQSHYMKQQVRSPQNSNNELATCQSVEQSSCKMSMIRKPPTLKKARSTSRKKQTSLVRSKITNESINSSNSIDKLNDAQQKIIEQKSEGNIQQKKKLLKPPTFNQNTLKQLQSPRFDSNVFQSQYEQTVNASAYRQLLAQNNPNRLLKQSAQKNKQQYNKIVDIEIPRPEFYHSLQKFYIHQQKDSNQTQINNIVVKNDENKDVANTNSQNAQSFSKSKSAPRFKSLQQARNMARECRIKMGDDHNRSNVQEKLSQLESFIAQKKQQSFLSKQEVKNIEYTKKEQQTSKKNMLSILDDLQQKQYDDDFQSYREDSSMKK